MAAAAKYYILQDFMNPSDTTYASVEEAETEINRQLNRDPSLVLTLAQHIDTYSAQVTINKSTATSSGSGSSGDSKK